MLSGGDISRKAKKVPDLTEIGGEKPIKQGNCRLNNKTVQPLNVNMRRNSVSH